ncbi:MAG: TetR/AcrR family transcriptional regulator [Pseudomonadota bacterium]|nr:TetR/AcrR family transcriptional regulator [Pseudomonadota bacterium]
MPRMVRSREDVLPELAEVFREFGYEGTSLALIGKRTGLGKGSLYHFFPGGKEEMATAVLEEIAGWFEQEMFAPLDQAVDPAAGIGAMFDATDAYFRTGRRVCLVGAFALDAGRDRFAGQIAGYFRRWVDVLRLALDRAGARDAAATARQVVAGIQGAIVLARALDDPEVFASEIGRLRRTCADCLTVGTG